MTAVRLEPVASRLESSTLPLSHCAPSNTNALSRLKIEHADLSCDAKYEVFLIASHNLGPSIPGLVTDGSTKVCCLHCIIAILQSTTTIKIDSG